MTSNLAISELTPNQLQALANCITAYNSNCMDVEIEETGYNEQSGNVYLALENGISIAAPDYRPSEVAYYGFNPETEEELSSESYKNLTYVIDVLTNQDDLRR